MTPLLSHRGWLHALAALVLLLAAMGQAQAQPPTARDTSVKAAFLYKFGSFVEWPPAAFRGPADPLVIGVWGNDAVAVELEQITQGRTVEGRPVQVVRVADADAPPQRLHILFAGGGREARLRDLLAGVRGPVLTVADGAAAARAGAVLFFNESGGRVRFGASLTAAQARQLKLSARLLAVAETVEGRIP